ncbi:hypothetical protein JDV02_009919 [Purpureocillium takamizusanense]|uniref:Uncharacterized protein n=1 Tax=Purpureocillium takamizusanense TaxID=2060973 RepID=A0A9Q8QRV9_9HYPO|nr:uncharacterized protein JDV02_009919 [Purpureocillium takamizusanense]UNI24146.1 hypothetical protein JDV02_009919 [Purpureocillium takamizusanense]
MTTQLEDMMKQLEALRGLLAEDGTRSHVRWVHGRLEATCQAAVAALADVKKKEEKEAALVQLREKVALGAEKEFENAKEKLLAHVTRLDLGELTRKVNKLAEDVGSSLDEADPATGGLKGQMSKVMASLTQLSASKGKMAEQVDEAAKALDGMCRGDTAVLSTAHFDQQLSKLTESARETGKCVSEAQKNAVTATQLDQIMDKVASKMDETRKSVLEGQKNAVTASHLDDSIVEVASKIDETHKSVLGVGKGALTASHFDERIVKVASKMDETHKSVLEAQKNAVTASDLGQVADKVDGAVNAMLKAQQDTLSGSHFIKAAQSISDGQAKAMGKVRAVDVKVDEMAKSLGSLILDQRGLVSKTHFDSTAVQQAGDIRKVAKDGAKAVDGIRKLSTRVRSLAEAAMKLGDGLSDLASEQSLKDSHELVLQSLSGLPTAESLDGKLADCSTKAQEQAQKLHEAVMQGLSSLPTAESLSKMLDEDDERRTKGADAVLKAIGSLNEAVKELPTGRQAEAACKSLEEAMGGKDGLASKVVDVRQTLSSLAKPDDVGRLLSDKLRALTLGKLSEGLDGLATAGQTKAMADRVDAHGEAAGKGFEAISQAVSSLAQDVSEKATARSQETLDRNMRSGLESMGKRFREEARSAGGQLMARVATSETALMRKLESMEATDADVEQLESELKAAREAKDAKDAEAKQLRSELQAVKEAKEAEIQQLKSDLQAAGEAKAKAEGRSEAAKEQLSVFQSSQLEAADRIVEQMKEQLLDCRGCADKNATIVKLQDAERKLSSRAHSLRAQREEFKESNGRLQRELAVAKDKARDSRAVSELAAEFEQVKQVLGKPLEMEKLRATLEDTQGALDSANGQISEHIKRINQLQGYLTTEEANYEEQRRRADALEVAGETWRREAATLNDAHDKELTDLQNQLQEERDARNKELGRIGKLEVQLATVTSERDGWQRMAQAAPEAQAASQKRASDSAAAASTPKRQRVEEEVPVLASRLQDLSRALKDVEVVPESRREFNLDLVAAELVVLQGGTADMAAALRTFAGSAQRGAFYCHRLVVQREGAVRMRHRIAVGEKCQRHPALSDCMLVRIVDDDNDGQPRFDYRNV